MSWSNKLKEKEYNKKYYQENRIFIIQNSIKRNENIPYNKERRKEYYLKNKDKLKIISLDYYYKNKDKIIKRIVKYNKIKYQTDEQFRIRELIRKRILVALKGQKRPSIDYKLIIDFLGSRPNKDYEIDHINPLCSFDLTNKEQFKNAILPENHRWITRKENRKKIAQDKLVSISR